MGRHSLGLKAGAAFLYFILQSTPVCSVRLELLPFLCISPSSVSLFCILSLGSPSFLLCLFLFLSLPPHFISICLSLSQLSLSSSLFFSILVFSSLCSLVSLPPQSLSSVFVSVSPRISYTPTPHLVSLSLLCSFSHSVNMD